MPETHLLKNAPRAMATVTPMRRLTIYLAALTLATCLHIDTQPSRRAVCGWLGASGASALVPTPPAFAAHAPPPWTLTAVPGVGDEEQRSYALLTLENGLRAIICADDTQNRCAMAATVRCGGARGPQHARRPACRAPCPPRR